MVGPQCCRLPQRQTHCDGLGGIRGKLWIQDLNRWEPRSMDGTEGAAAPFWSPDGQFIAYAAGNQLMKVRVDGGPANRVCPLPNSWFFGGTWSPDGESIVFASDELFEVPASGGAARPLRMPDESLKRKYTPWFLPSKTAERVLVLLGRSQQWKPVPLRSPDQPAEVAGTRLQAILVTHGPPCVPAGRIHFRTMGSAVFSGEAASNRKGLRHCSRRRSNRR